jgi:hypothetical protein
LSWLIFYVFSRFLLLQAVQSIIPNILHHQSSAIHHWLPHFNDNATKAKNLNAIKPESKLAYLEMPNYGTQQSNELFYFWE